MNSLLIFYKHVPSVTNFPVYLGALDELLDPFVQDMDEELAKKMIRLFLIHVDRTVLDSFSHANVGREIPRQEGSSWRWKQNWNRLYRTSR